MTIREEGQRVQPTISRFAVFSIIQGDSGQNTGNCFFFFCHYVNIYSLTIGINRCFSATLCQHQKIVDTVRQNKTIKLCEIQQKVIEDLKSFSLSIINRVLKRNRRRIKQLYKQGQGAKILVCTGRYTSRHIQCWLLYSRPSDMVLYVVQIGSGYSILQFTVQHTVGLSSVSLTKLYLFLQCFNWMPWKDQMNVFSWMMLGSVWPKRGGEPRNVDRPVGHCRRPWPEWLQYDVMCCHQVIMEFSTITPPWGHITPNVSWHFWVIDERSC